MAIQQARLTAAEPRTGGVGISVAIAGDVAVVGAPFEHTVGGEQAGAAYVFTGSAGAWTQQARLIGWDADRFDRFGWSVAIAGDAIIVGAPHGPGVVYCFVRDGAEWRPRWKIAGPGGVDFGDTLAIGRDIVLVGGGSTGSKVYAYRRADTEWHADGELVGPPDSGGLFGSSAAFSADTELAIVGADRYPNGTPHGAAFVFERRPPRWFRRAKLTAPDLQSGAGFGESVAISGFTALVGAPFSGPEEIRVGQVYVFTLGENGWVFAQRLRASDPGMNDHFGHRVALSGNTALIGAPGDDTTAGKDTGSVYVFQRTLAGWTEQAKLVLSESAPGDGLGASVALDGDSAIVGAPQDRRPGRPGRPGAAHVFSRPSGTWSPQATLQTREPSTHDAFGDSVAVAGDVAVVGAPRDDPGATSDAGAAYVFERSGTAWTQRTRLTASDPTNGVIFGAAAALSGDTMVIGAPAEVNTAGLEIPGWAYIFVRQGSSWAQQAKLVPSDGQPRNLFGNAVSISGDTVVIGARLVTTVAGQSAGATYVFTRTGTAWTQQTKLVASNGKAFDLFGNAVGIFGDTVVVGARGHDTAAGTDAGAAYVYVRSGGRWTEQAKLVAADAVPHHRLGSSVAGSGDVVVVGAPGRAVPPPVVPGRAYVFARNGTSWTQQAQLVAADAARFGFGTSVALVGETAIVSDPGGTAVYVFAREGGSWRQQDKLTGTSADGRFGSVALSGETVVAGKTVVVGAPSAITTPAGPTGAALVFTLGSSAFEELRAEVAELRRHIGVLQTQLTDLSGGMERPYPAEDIAGSSARDAAPTRSQVLGLGGSRGACVAARAAVALVTLEARRLVMSARLTRLA